MGNSNAGRLGGLLRAHIRAPFISIQPERLAGGLHA